MLIYWISSQVAVHNATATLDRRREERRGKDRARRGGGGGFNTPSRSNTTNEFTSRGGADFQSTTGEWGTKTHKSFNGEY